MSMEKYTQKYMLTYYSQNNTVAIANKNKNRKQENNTRETQKNTHTCRETRKGSRAVKYIIFIIRARVASQISRSIITHSSRLMEFVYYTYGNFLFLGPTALIYISKERRCNEGLRGVEHFKNRTSN